MPKQTFLCWVPDYSDREHADKIEAWDDEEAAEKCCEYYHDGCAEYPMDTTVCVLVGDEVKTFNVTWEARRDYSAEEKK